jgi:DNA-binding GntR family transcriptional regulator
MGEFMKNGTLKEKAYQILKERLVYCVYKPGTILNETQLAADLGVSRTPIREITARLEQEGYVKVLPKKGIFVTEVTVVDALQIFQTRIEIEPIAVRLAGPHLPEEELRRFYGQFSGDAESVEEGLQIDTAMHLFIIEYCGNRYIIDLMHRVFDDAIRVNIATEQNKVKIHDARLEHREVLQLLLEKRYEEASLRMRTHLECCRRAAMEYFYSQQVYRMPETVTYQKVLTMESKK